MNIGLIGTGAIGNFIIQQLNKEQQIPGHHVTAVFDERNSSKDKLKKLEEETGIKGYDDLDVFLNAPIDLVIECATIDVVEQYAREILRRKDLMVISIGALVHDQLRTDLEKIAQETKHNLYLPSGALGGLDALLAAQMLDGLTQVRLTSSKPAAALGAPHLNQAETIFKGPAQEAIKKFPKNANVAIIVALAGIGMERTEVEIIADPEATQNTHQLEATGAFGEFSMKLTNDPSPHNPKTSYLTALSILSTLKKQTDPIKIG